jgi:uncharacterized protein YqgV (UPF0045/DUF77 family)
MIISAELSLYPLAQDNYASIIKAYIRRLQQQDNIEINRQSMSTTLYGEYDHVMRAIDLATREVFAQDGTAVLVAKILNGDRRHSG